MVGLVLKSVVGVLVVLMALVALVQLRVLVALVQLVLALASSVLATFQELAEQQSLVMMGEQVLIF